METNFLVPGLDQVRNEMRRTRPRRLAITKVFLTAKTLGQRPGRLESTISTFRRHSPMADIQGIAKSFVDFYYSTFDKSRQELTPLYASFKVLRDTHHT